MASATVRVFEVLYHVDDDHPSAHGGAAGDGSFVFRTRDEAEATRFAANQRYYDEEVREELGDYYGHQWRRASNWTPATADQDATARWAKVAGT